MGLFFKKRNYINKNDFLEFEKRIQSAFEKVKDNFSEVKTWTESTNTINVQSNNQFELLQQKIQSLETQIQFLQQSVLATPQKQVEKEQVEPVDETEHDLFEELTHTQVAVLATIYKLITISKKSWIPVKSIAKEYYPTKKYNNVKGILSQYTDLLLEFYVIKKQLRGVNTYVSLTDKGKSFCDENKDELLDKLKESSLDPLG